MADITDQLNRIVDDLSGLEDRLELGSFIHIHQVFVEIKAGGSEQGTSVIMQVSGKSLSFLFLELDGSVEQDLLLFLFHVIDPVLKTKYTSLVKNDKDDQSYGQHDHAQGSEEQDQGNT